MHILERINSIIWGVPTVTLILAVGFYLSIRTGFAQLRLLPDSIRQLYHQLRKPEDGSSFRALCTALAATVGTGNIAGVAGAIAIGGPGSIFWIWICAILGMITKYAEALLAVKFRVQKTDEAYAGGPMYMIDNGLGKKWHPMAVCYSVLGTAAAFGVGNAAQVNAAVNSADTAVAFLGGQGHLWTILLLGGILAGLAAMAPLGGAKRVGSIAELLVPVAAVAYTVLCVGALIYHRQSIPDALQRILQGAFQPRAVTGGAVGSCMTVLRIGAARGVFTNEAGMGTAAIAHGTANVEHPARQGLMGIMEVFLDTIVICTMTALVILCSGTSIQYGVDSAIHLTVQAFSDALGDWVCIPIALFMCCFALATILGWGLYGIRCAQFLFGSGCWKSFAYTQAITAIISSVLGTATVWSLAEMVNGLMVIPNLIVLAYLTPELKRLSTQYMHYKMRTPLTNGAFKC